MMRSSSRCGSARRLQGAFAGAILAALLCGGSASAETVGPLSGNVRGDSGTAIPGALVTLQMGSPGHAVTVYTNDAGTFRLPAVEGSGATRLRIRRIGWKDLTLAGADLPTGTVLRLTLERETDPGKVAAQLPANRWYHLVLDRMEDESQREELVRQCTYCHQQGNWATRMVRDEEEWEKILALMARMGATLSSDLRDQLPALFNAAYDPAVAVPVLTAHMNEAEFEPPASLEARKAIIDEWVLGGAASMQHDLTVHPNGNIYSVDMTQDKLYQLDPAVPGGARKSWDVPSEGLPPGGIFASAATPDVPTSNARMGPHSLQVAPDESIWITLALGNRLARFDLETEEWSLHELREGFYPHTLRFDPRGRVWYTIAASNHIGMFDPATGEHREMRLPARGFGQAVVLRMLPFLLWLNQRFDLQGVAAGGGGMTLPVPYGIDVESDGTVWFSQLNEHRIGRVDPDSYEIEMIDTPFPAPRRLRFDSKGKLWIPSFSASLISRFDPETRTFESWEIPIEPRGSDTPYALHVDRRTDTVWITGTNSDTLIRFEPEPQRFTVYPLPTRVTYTRELDFDSEGRVWTSNSNVPTWQIEGGLPRILRLDPDGATALEVAARTTP